MLILIIIVMGASWFVGYRFNQKIKEYSATPLSKGLSGAEIAHKMLSDHGIYDVKIVSVQGRLTDHYNPLDKTVNLSPEIYSGRSIAAAAVAAHECGHAIQHATAYSWLTMRSKLVPFVSASSRYMQWVLLAGILTISVFPYLLLAGIVLFALTTIFSFVTLPVEFDATKRALVWLDGAGITVSREHEQAREALKWAANTYVVAALSSLATLLYYVMIFLRRD